VDSLSLNLGKIAGVHVSIHHTLWLVFLMVAFSLATGYMPHHYPGLPAYVYWIIGLTSAMILFGSVLLHELCHSYIAMRNGIPVGRITLFFFGGVSEITEEPKSPDVEFRMAAVGPASSFLIAIVLGTFWYLFKSSNLSVGPTAIMEYGATINVMLGGFNLLPAFPLDGGRVFRAILWRRRRDLLKSTMTAAKVGVGLAYLMMFGGFVVMFFGGFFNGVWTIMMGWFLKSGAESSMSQTIIGEAFSKMRVGEVMSKNVITVDPDLTIEELVKNNFLVYRYAAYPVPEDGEIWGMVTMEMLKQVPRERWNQTKVKYIMIPVDRLVMVRSDTLASDVMYKMARYGAGRVLIVDEGKLLGIVSHSDLMRVVRTRVEVGL